MFKALWKPAILGLVQGLTEFLPVSSTAHIHLSARLLGLQSPGMVLDTSLHLGTLLATLAWLAGELASDPSLLQLPVLAKVALATLPAGLAGLLLHDWIERHLRGPRLSALMLMLGGGFLGLATRRQQQEASARPLSALSYRAALGLGLAQMLALMPGLSRSGMTLAAGLLAGLSHRDSLRFSFLMSLPVVAGSGLLKLRTLRQELRTPALWQTLAIGSASAALSGYLVLGQSLQRLQSQATEVLSLYRIFLGAGLLWQARGGGSKNG
ncbi:MAG: undecaprenyl-diphosphate phosphatase [Candidatus Sericytochromatia bacterium]|nr:undecaprenyl-diphosphate phosphatase [Candidatus Sericytochromatia bacterium]